MTLDQMTARQTGMGAYCEDIEMERDRAIAASRKWRLAFIILFVGGTIQWLACNFAP